MFLSIQSSAETYIQLRFYFVDLLLVSTVCPNMEVRNGPQQFSELEGCRVAGTEIVMVELQPGYIAPHHWGKSKRLHVLPVIIW